MFEEPLRQAAKRRAEQLEGERRRLRRPHPRLGPSITRRAFRWLLSRLRRRRVQPATAHRAGLLTVL